ncbi:MAG: HAMP domain-containing sensor histidine kinase [Bacteroidales bacterium]|nr:HAMP domain-containing sensor histidine kinase [Bacteroidales bacterium]
MTTVVVLVVVIVFVGMAFFFHHQNRLKLRARLMREAVRNHEFTFHLPVRGLFYGERALQEALNGLGQDINKLVAQKEVESWQKLTRVLTHEIMNVCTPIQSISQAYLEHPKVVGTSLEKGIHAINEAAGNLVAFVVGYRKLTQLQEPVIASLQLKCLVASIMALYPNVAWKVDIPEDTVVNTDESLLRQVLGNIIKNAMEADAQIVECAWRESALRISNNGTPIPAEVRRDIFVPFYTTKSTGTGIGLALSRQIMAMLGGSLELTGKADSGYHVTFVLDLGQNK